MYNRIKKQETEIETVQDIFPTTQNLDSKEEQKAGGYEGSETVKAQNLKFFFLFKFSTFSISVIIFKRKLFAVFFSLSLLNYFISAALFKLLFLACVASIFRKFIN